MRYSTPRHGFDAAAFAALSGTLKAGSWLVLLLPVWEEWENQPDADSLRWSDCPDPIATPHFVQHLKRVLTADNDAILWRQNQPFSLAHFTPRTDWHPATGAPQPEQQQLLQQLLTMPPGVAAVTAARGRGKSALVGQTHFSYCGQCDCHRARKSGNGCTGTICGREVSLYCTGCLVSQR
ncbi:putative ATP-dependent acetyltransferase [Escherichia coli]|uniref:Putative ATP-dependent acetyltransferase n=1 Tax=Escherichia coli TaxID=562 RepID=A0A376KQY7_ECOLX|nr:putative ATP-dependent acetyltransferase [Escherichia coli]